MSSQLQWITSISHLSIPSLQTMAVFVSLTFACTPDDGSAPNVVRRDSANLVIVENLGSPPRDGGGWVVSEAPLARSVRVTRGTMDLAATRHGTR